MKASDVMVTNVITVGPDACVQDIAGILLGCRISAVPVVESNGKLVGIVSEGEADVEIVDFGATPAGKSRNERSAA
jgi:CBS domain-containing protein